MQLPLPLRNCPLLPAPVVAQVGAFPFVFAIMGPIVWGGGSIEAAWKAGCAGNFIVGLVGIVLGIIFGIPACANAILKVGECQDGSQPSHPCVTVDLICNPL